MDAVASPSTSDRPFGAPLAIAHVVDLPLPPSVNRLWRSAGKKVFRSQEYQDWQRQADLAFMCVKRGQVRTIQGEFIAVIEFKRPRTNADLDNRTKAVLDFAQRVGLIANDKNAVEITLRWSDEAALGCRLKLKSVGYQPEPVDSWQTIGGAAARVVQGLRK